MLPWTGIARYRRLLARAVKDGPLVHMDNAYVDVCDIGYLPCNGNPDGERCPFKNSRRSSSNRCFRLQTNNLYDGAALQVYVSPLHRDTISSIRGTRGPELIMRPTLNPRPFQASQRDADRDIPLLFVGSFTEAKGAEEIRRRWPGGEVQVVGPATPEATQYVGYQGEVPHHELPELMARANEFVFLPRWPEPFGRVVSEAVLSGCALVTNGNVGAHSFARDLADPSLYEGATEELWERLEAVGCH
jgi:glycosyltransferase involved in cell wall biosynthesis